MEPDNEDGSFFLTLGNTDSPAAALEVMKDDANGFYGFRSQKAGDRFLQANRRKTRRLLLFNHNFGTNEQWRLLRSPNESWDKRRCSFQHRRNEVRKIRLNSQGHVGLTCDFIHCDCGAVESHY